MGDIVPAMGDGEGTQPTLLSPHWSGVLWGKRSGGWRALLQGAELKPHGGLDARDVDGTTLLHAAAARGDLPIVAALLHSGADPFIPDEEGRTAQQHAAAGKHEACAAMLELVAERYEYAQHSMWLASQAAHGKPAPGAPLRALRTPMDLGNRRRPKPNHPKWLPPAACRRSSASSRALRQYGQLRCHPRASPSLPCRGFNTWEKWG
jgi:hypothetical protein